MPLTNWLHPRATSQAKPFSVPTSQTWDGDDGYWSTFLIQVGTPPQTFRVLPATNGDETWVPIPLGCTNASIPNPPSNCGGLRGANPFQVRPSQGFDTNASSSWQSNGIFNLIREENLGINENGEYGYDTVTIGANPSALTLPHQVVAGIATREFWLGSFGLGPKPANFSAAIPSFMANLAAQNLIPSLSFGYTAGARYNTSSSSFGSLTLGGYDKARHIANDVAFNFDANDSRSLTVGVQTIFASNTLQGTVSAITSPGIYSLIDSGVPDIWLPRDACDVFEQAFGLTYDNTSQRYLIDDATHTKMDQLNPIVVFNIGPLADASNTKTETNSGSSVAIKLPYAAFVLQASYPLYPNATLYFPIRRAANDTQYTIGRAFLQEAYITVNYERSVFHVSQATSSTSNEQNLIPISSTDSTFDTISHPHSISSGAFPGIIIGAVALLFFLCALAYFYLRRRRRLQQQQRERQPQQPCDSTTSMTQTTPTHPNSELTDLSGYLSPTDNDKAEWEKTLEKNLHPSSFSPSSHATVELPTPIPTLPLRRHQELPGSPAAGELDAKRQAIYELPTDDQWMAELPHATPGAEGQIRRKERPRRNLVLQI